MNFTDFIARITVEKKDQIYNVVVDNMTAEIIIAVGVALAIILFVYLKYKK